MAGDLPSTIACALDTSHPEQPEDFTDWELDEETGGKMAKLESEVPGDWDLVGDSR